jgi:hypothetical protein
VARCWSRRPRGRRKPPRSPRPRREAEVPDEPEEQDEKNSSEETGEENFWISESEVLALSEDAIYLANLDEKEMRRASKALRAGEPVEEVLEEPKKVIPFAFLKKVESNRYPEVVSIAWRGPDDSEDSDETIVCANKEDRDAFFKALLRQLDPDWKREVIEFSRLKASIAPLIVLGFCGFVTFCFYMAGTHPESDRRGGRVVRTNIIGVIVAWIYNLFGPWGVVIVGGFFIALGLAWLAARLHRPPIMLTLLPREGPGRKKKRR